jgi:hypothetical protein
MALKLNVINFSVSKYIQDSRNLKRLIDYAKTEERLVQGRRKVIDYLKHLPQTQHIPSTFAVDMTIFNVS